MKIAQKLILGMVAPAFLIALVSWYVSSVAQDRLRNLIDETTASFASAVMAEIDRAMLFRVSTWQAYGLTSAVQSFLKQANAEMAASENPLALIAQRDAAWRGTEKNQPNPFMQRLLDNRLSKELMALVNRINENYGYVVYPEIFITNRYGANVGQTNLTTDYRQDDETWWQIARDRGLYIGDLAYDESADMHATDLAIRYDDEDGNFLGVIKVVAGIGDIQSIITNSRPETGLSESVKTILFTGDRKIIHTNQNDETVLQSGNDYFSDVELSDDVNVQTVQRYDALTGNELLSTYATSQGIGNGVGLNWVLLHEYRAEDIYKPVIRLQRVMLLIAGGATLIALIIGGSIAFSLSGRIRHLVQATKQFEHGFYYNKVQMEGTDEIASLASSFNQMSKTVHDEFEKRKQTEQDLRIANDRMTKDLEAAAAVQKALLPGNLPNSSRASFGWAFEPSAGLAGDMLNIFRIDEHHVGMYVFDVCGHGVRSSLLSIALSHSLTPRSDTSSLVTSSSGAVTDPVEVVSKLNERYQMSYYGGLYSTILYGVLNLDRGLFRYVSAGHAGPIVVDNNGDVSVHDKPAFPVGMFDNPDYMESTLALKSGDRLYIHTDGVHEERNKHGKIFGREAVVDVLKNAKLMTLASSIEALVSEVQAWCGDDQFQDDLTVIGAEYRGAH